MIRTGGEQRLSNFLIWQSAYAELLHDRGPLAGLRRRRVRRRAARVRQPDPPLRALIPAPNADPDEVLMLRQRAISAAILVPPLVIALLARRAVDRRS